MKTKDIIGLALALVLVVGVGIFYVSSQAPHKTSAATNSKQAEVAPVLSDQLDGSDTLTKMNSEYHVRDYKVPVDLTSGLGNTTLFGQ